MMKRYSFLAAGVGLVLASFSGTSWSAQSISPFVYETPREFFAQPDLDKDGRVDVVIVDKATGKYRLGYQTTAGLFSWVDCRPSNIKGVTGFTIGKLLPKTDDALAFTSPDANQISIVEASSPTAPGRPLTVPFSAALGPNTIVAIDVGGAGNQPDLMDFYVASIYNSPDANLATMLRNNGTDFPKTTEATLTGPAGHGNHLAFKAGQPQLLTVIVSEDSGDSLHVEDLSSGKPVDAAVVSGLPAGSEYTLGDFKNSGSPEFLFYKPGQNTLTVRPVESASAGKVQFAKGESFDLGQPVRRAVTLTQGTARKLLVIFGEGEKATVYNFDGTKAPAPVQTFQATNDLFTFAASTDDGLVLFAQAADGKFSTKYLTFKASGETYVAGPYGSLPSLADNDNITIPDIHSRIVASSKEANQADMKLYTNTIPGTRVNYVMVPIPGGEFTMGSPDSEPDRKPDEGPQHKVKIEPFWMGQCEVTWNEYELFMYPDEEKRMRSTTPTDASGDKLADAVTHPSKPYVEMSFGMGKDGFPAISMTHHAANKYCQWLSAKTGQFYRLPTEAEWEYACRAGTTTPYFFGDASKLGEYAWYEQNSDFKYQKVGKKKPNPWGLYDICGNVLEWTLDQYDPEYYKQSAAAGVSIEPWNKATKPYPHSARGGSWDDEAKSLRSAARRGSERTWKMTDPQLPKSIWYLSDAQWVGFRVIRPLKVPPPEAMQKYWTSGTEKD